MKGQSEAVIQALQILTAAAAHSPQVTIIIYNNNHYNIYIYPHI
jgi:hypothetical protein